MIASENSGGASGTSRVDQKKVAGKRSGDTKGLPGHLRRGKDQGACAGGKLGPWHNEKMCDSLALFQSARLCRLEGKGADSPGALDKFC